MDTHSVSQLTHTKLNTHTFPPYLSPVSAHKINEGTNKKGRERDRVLCNSLPLGEEGGEHGHLTHREY